MKYLKYFNESALSEDVMQDLNDICLELTDVGFKVDIYNEDDHKDVIIFKPNHGLFKYKEVKDVVERIKDYIKDQNYSIEIEKVNKTGDPYVPNMDKGIDTLFINLQQIK